MSDDFNSEEVRAIAKFLRGMYQDKVIAELETQVQELTHIPTVPDPNDCHPALSHAANFVREYDQNVVQIMALNNKHVRCSAEHINPSDFVPTKKLVLTRKRCMGPAPFVGSPRNTAMYEWSVWVDDYGRYISGDAHLIWRYGPP
jgi:hypothetical protein